MWGPSAHSLHFCSSFLFPYLGFHFTFISLPDKPSSSIFLVTKQVRSILVCLLGTPFKVPSTWITRDFCSPWRQFPALVFLSLPHYLWSFSFSFFYFLNTSIFNSFLTDESYGFNSASHRTLIFCSFLKSSFHALKPPYANWGYSGGMTWWPIFLLLLFRESGGLSEIIP